MGQSGQYPISSNGVRRLRTVGRCCQQGARKAQALPNSWLERYVGESAPQDKRVAATTRLPVVIPSMANLNKASGSINGKRRAVVYGYFENDAPGPAQTSLNAYGIQKRRADTFSPTARQYTKC